MCFTGEQICKREKLLFCTGDYNMENGSKFYMVKKKALPEILLKVAEANVLLNIGKAKSSLIINTIIGKDLTTDYIYGESNLITSLVVGNYNQKIIATADSSVYESFINGNYERRFDGKPVILPEQQNSNTTAQNSDEKNRLTYNDEANKRKFGNDINTSFKRRFSPRGFAAQEDEINELKNSTKSSIVKTNIKMWQLL